MLTFPNAKINLGLHVLNKRPDGYHNIETCFLPIPWSDILEILPSDVLGSNGFELHCTGLLVGISSNSNLVSKAWALLNSEFNLLPFRGFLHKILPIGAGLGGGSSDAAFALKMFNQLNNLGLDETELEMYAGKLGADCSFFIRNQPAIGSGKGDELKAVNINLKGFYITVLYPGFPISTAEAYMDIKPNAYRNSIEGLIQSPLAEWKDNLINDFEKSAFLRYPVLSGIKNHFYDKGAIYASMSGSGSAMFGIFEKEQNWQKQWPENYLVWQGVL